MKRRQADKIVKLYLSTLWDLCTGRIVNSSRGTAGLMLFDPRNVIPHSRRTFFEAVRVSARRGFLSRDVEFKGESA